MLSKDNGSPDEASPNEPSSHPTVDGMCVASCITLDSHHGFLHSIS